LKEMNIKRKAGYHGLEQLKNAGLVRIKQLPGRNPLVTVLDLEGNPVQ